MSNIGKLEALFDCVLQLSSQTEGRPADWRGQQTSLVFAKFAVTCLSFLRLIPSGTFFSPAKGLSPWDLASAASLCRNLMEAYYVLFYISSDPIDKEDQEFREALWEYHGAFERHEMLQGALPNSKRMQEAIRPLVETRARLERSSRFQSFEPKRQKNLLKFPEFMLRTKTELSRAAGISEKYYRTQYKLCSNFSHSSPFSIQLLDSFRAGTPEAEQILSPLIGLATGYTAFAIREFVRLFPDQEASLPTHARECISTWEAVFKWEKQPWFNEPSKAPPA